MLEAHSGPIQECSTNCSSSIDALLSSIALQLRGYHGGPCADPEEPLLVHLAVIPANNDLLNSKNWTREVESFTESAQI